MIISKSSSGMKLLVPQLTIFMKSMPLSLYCIKPTQICWCPKENSFCGTNVYPTPQSNGFRSWCAIESGSLVWLTAKRHYIQVHLYQQKRRVVLNYAIPPPWNVLGVSMEKPPQDLLKILLQDHHPRNKFSNKTISSLAIAYQPTIMFLPSLVKSHTCLARYKAVIHVVAYLLITQVVRFSTFPNIQPMLLKLSKIHFDWKRWLWKKDSRSRNITPTTESFLQLNSKSTTQDNIKSTRLVALGQNTRTELPKGILKWLRNGCTPTCFTLQPIGPNTPTQNIGCRWLIMLHGFSTDFQIWNLA